ncbi:hypothetical protein APHAL10511_002320 [Amanita phalloides]|nr:hypothetical protein APHAL10511_002320 [Amanita phalloides]
MHTARGNFKNNDNHFSVKFFVESEHHSVEFEGVFTKPVPRIKKAFAAVEYDDTRELFGTYEIEPGSTVGRDILTLMIRNVRDDILTITGELERPGLDKTYPLQGHGRWLIHRK